MKEMLLRLKFRPQLGILNLILGRKLKFIRLNSLEKAMTNSLSVQSWLSLVAGPSFWLLGHSYPGETSRLILLVTTTCSAKVSTWRTFTSYSRL